MQISDNNSYRHGNTKVYCNRCMVRLPENSEDTASGIELRIFKLVSDATAKTPVLT